MVANFRHDESGGKNQWCFDKSRTIRIGKYIKEKKKENRMRGTEMEGTIGYMIDNNNMLL